MKYRTYPEDPYPHYEVYEAGDRVVYVGHAEESNSYEIMVGRTGTVTDFWEGDEETNPMVEVDWDDDLAGIDPVERGYFASANPWLLAFITRPTQTVLVAFVAQGRTEGQAARNVAGLLPRDPDTDTAGVVESWTMLSREAAEGAGQQWSDEAERYEAVPVHEPDDGEATREALLADDLLQMHADGVVDLRKWESGRLFVQEWTDPNYTTGAARQVLEEIR